MKTLFRLLVLLVTYSNSIAQTGTWTWMKGDDTTNQAGHFGTVGSPLNNPPAMAYSASWIDTTGNFWIFGGAGLGVHSALWKFEPITNNWTWMSGSSSTGDTAHITAAKGVYTSTNSPEGVAYVFSWRTSDNHFWLYSNSGYLWQYDPAINQWAWMGSFTQLNPGVKGTGTNQTRPGSRSQGYAAWTDNSDNLWLFGGNSLNDLWKYDISTGIWTWISGTHNVNDSGNYGTMGVPDVNNYPPSLSTRFFWKGSDGSFWLYSGSGYQNVWRFNPSTLEWTWISGPEGLCSIGPTSGSICDTTNDILTGPISGMAWKICDNLLISYNGVSFKSSYIFGNDIWAYDIDRSKWMPITNSIVPGTYGTLGVADTSTLLPARNGSVGFMDKQNNLWIFGGYGDWTTHEYYNDLWKYTFDTTCAIFNSCNQITNISSTASIIAAIKIYPNPSHNTWQLEVSNDWLNSNMEVFDTEGRLVFKSAIQNSKSAISFDAARGVYIMRIYNQQKNLTQKLVKW